MKQLIFIFAIGLFMSCQTPGNDSGESNDQNLVNEIEQSNEQPQKDPPVVSKKIIRVTVVPCSNGYDYGHHQGDLNPFLEKHLSVLEGIELVPFPLNKMNGSGYQGVYDKKHCDKILENTDVDFLIMTKMRGDLLVSEGETNNSWGYSTRILNTATLEQKNGIEAFYLSSFDEIDSDIEAKIGRLASLLRSSI